MSDQPASRKERPSRRQIIFNWMMGESDFATMKDGHWGGTEEVAHAEALLAALDAAAPLSATPFNILAEPSEELREKYKTSSPEERQRLIHEHDCPKAWDFFNRWSTGSKVCPSCLLCGKQYFDRKEEWAIQHAVLPDIYICKPCVTAARSTTRTLPDIPTELFHGEAVYVELGIEANIPARHVSDVLDALVRVIRKNRRAAATVPSATGALPK